MGGKRQSLIPTFQQGQKEKISITKKATLSSGFFIMSSSKLLTLIPTNSIQEVCRSFDTIN